MATKVKVRFSKSFKALDKKLKKISQDKTVLNDVGEFVVKRNQLFARKATPIQGKSVGRFPSLKDATIRERQRLSRFNRTHPTFNASRSNVTLTGQLVDSLSFRIAKGVLELFFKGTRKAYRTGPNSRGEIKTNDEVYEELLGVNRNFRFLGLDEKGLDLVKKRIIRQLRRLLK